ncbi:Transposon TX1 uncharacterized protein [Nymphaea thermarum]|nr:Transposon TX1 uncharacterized protein [Nymphaea thermarum]
MSVISHACVCTLMRQSSFGFLPACGTADGILLAWSPPLTGVIVHVGRYSISASLSRFWPNGPVLVIAVYGPCVGALRGQLWAELLQVRQVVAAPWLLAGDFNYLLSPADSSSPVTSGPSMSAFRSFVEEFGLFDVPSTNGTFTWSNNRNPPILRRLDRIFLSPELFSAFPSSSLVLGPRHLSDHAPLLLSLLRGRAGIGHARFRFELWWLRDESFVATVPNWWARAVNGRWEAFRLSRKLHSIRREALAWKRIFWSSKFLEVAAWDEEIMSLQASDNISADQSSRLLCLQCLAEEWRIRESIHWQQRSRLGWLAHGDQNSRFFHLTASQRRRQTLLQSLLIGGRVFLGDDILPALSAHFRDFYSKPLRFRATLLDFHLSSLSVSCAIALERPFHQQEIKNAVWALGSGKASGIDGFPIEFFRTFWKVCSADVFAFCDEFASNFVFLKEFNQATCVLVPKRPNPTDVTHFRPISILGAPYKIIAKLLSLRLAPVMSSVINPFQYADDFLLFGGASRQQIVRTWLILRVFELTSGLSINSAKCHLSLIHADPATVLLAEACFGCKASSLPMDYLGLQITLSPPAPSFWDGLEQKLIDRLQCWFDKLIRKFVWDGDRPSDRLAHWDVVAFPRLLGGAGVTNLSRACESSLCFWWWRLATEHSPITQFISSKFDLPSPSIWHSSISHPSPSHFWSDMLSVLPLFLRLADLSSSTSPSWPLSPTREFTFSSCYLASFGPSVASLPPRSLWSPGPSPRAIAFVWLLLTGHINTFDHLQRLGISLANQCPICLVATESQVHLFTSCPFFSSVLAYTWPSLVSSLPNPPSIRLLFLFCPSPRLTASWSHVWRSWLISAWWRIWVERNNRVLRGTFSSPDSVARLVQGDVQFATRLKRRCTSAVE